MFRLLTRFSNVTDIFKTPGKLRGKTPRTARKRNPLEAREPLSDIFSTNIQTVPISPQRTNPVKAASSPKIAAFKFAEDCPPQAEATKKRNADTYSGYYELPEADMNVDTPPAQSSADTHNTLGDVSHPQSRSSVPADSRLEDRSITEPSFHSAKGEVTKRDVVTNVESENEVKVAHDKVIEATQEEIPPLARCDTARTVAMEILEKDVDADLANADSRSTSQASSPARTLVRKSSLTFAALPAREPITTKRSMGARASRTSHLDQVKAPAVQGSFLGRITGGKSLGGIKQPDSMEIAGDDETDICEDTTDRPQIASEVPDNDSKMTELHNKSSTQRLHERINLLGKSQQPRPTNTIPATALTVQPQYPHLPKQDPQKWKAQLSTQPGVSEMNDEDDDWIQPPQSQHQAQAGPQLTKKVPPALMDNVGSKQATGHEQMTREQNHDSLTRGTQTSKEIARPSGATAPPQAPTTVTADFRIAANTLEATEAFYPDLGKPADASTTPIGTPLSKRYVDGPLSASKWKLQSIMKTAKGLFSSSAGVSAQAKMETMSPSLAHRREQMITEPPISGEQVASAVVANQQGVEAAQAVTRAPEVRKTRSSTEKEERIKAKKNAELQRVKPEIERARKQECTIQKQAQSTNVHGEETQAQTKPVRTSPRKTGQQQIVQSQSETNESERDLQSMGPPATHGPGRPSQVQRLKDVRRPLKPAKDTAPKAKGPPVNIRVGMPSQRVPLTNATLSSSLQESLPPAQAKEPGIIKKASTASLQSSVSNSHPKNSTTTSKPKALIAAERKKEQDEREAQRKLDQKREIERKRAAQQEEAKRQEQFQRQEAEKQRERERSAVAEDPKKIAQRQAIEKRRLEMQKKDQRPPQAPSTMHPQHTGPMTRPELGATRPPSRQRNLPDPPRPAANHHALNPSKAPIKRVFDPEADEAPTRPARPQGGPSYQQNNTKRRKTEEEELEEFPIRPTMAPPIRQSGMRKDGPKASIFGSNHSAAPPPASHHPHAPSLLKSTTSNQAYQQHTYQNQQPRQGYQPDMSKYRDGNKIPFADNPNPPHHQHSQPHKTPLPSKLAQPSRNSPQYVNGENIQLAEIPTDSEDSESSPDTAQKRQRAASLPDWAQSPNLRQLLEQQEDHLDADAVFGPVASPHMEEMFRERHHRFRSRTSSANWTGQDRLTEEEIRRDVEARARMRREGGWTFGL
ncbi:MAG: hypothetical protein Q9217_005168 [Psora testacea]